MKYSRFNINKLFLKNKFDQGSTLIEIMMAAFVLSMVMVALISGLAYSIKTTTESNHRSEANKYAKEAIEMFERQRTLRSWQNFTTVDLAGVTTICLTSIPEFTVDFQSSINPAACSPGSDEISGTEFLRQADLTYPDANTVQVVVTVNWPNPRGASDHQVKIETEFKKSDFF